MNVLICKFIKTEKGCFENVVLLREKNFTRILNAEDTIDVIVRNKDIHSELSRLIHED